MLRPPAKFIFDSGPDELLQQAVEIVCQYDRASASLLQRRLSIGYARASRLIDQLESAGAVGPAEGAKPRDVLVSSPDLVDTKTIVKRAEEDDPFLLPKNYKVPTDINLTIVDKPEWGRQLGDVIKLPEFTNDNLKYPVILGIGENGELNIVDLADLGNLLIVGNPTSKKDNFIDSILVTLLLKKSPKELRFVLIDSTHYLDCYNGIPHLLAPVISEYQADISAYRWALSEVERRMRLFTQAGVRTIESYNQQKKENLLPRILIVTFVEWMDEKLNDVLTSLTSVGFRAGIHLFLVSTRLNDKSVSPDIKANVPARAVFRVTSPNESTQAGLKRAENLGVGEMLYKQGNTEPKKFTTILTLDVNVKEVVEAVKRTTK